MWSTRPLFSTGAALVVMIILQTLALGFEFDSFGSWFATWWQNWINILRNNSGIGIIALGMTFVIISGGIDLAVVVADGLSALAVHKHTLPFLTRMEEQTHAEGWSLSPVILVEQGRVAVADEIGQLLGAKMVVILIGERPGSVRRTAWACISPTTPRLASPMRTATASPTCAWRV